MSLQSLRLSKNVAIFFLVAKEATWPEEAEGVGPTEGMVRPPTTRPTTERAEMTTSIDQSVRDYIAAKEALEAAEVAKKRAEATMKNLMAGSGIHSVTVDNTIVTVSETTRTSYDTEALSALISAHTFKKVTKPTVDAEAFRAAVAVGLISEDVVDTVAKTTTFSTVRVTVRKNAKASA